MKNIFSALLMVVLLFAITPPVLADSSNPPTNDPNAQIGYTETFERITWQKLPTLEGVAPLASGCKTYTVGVNGYNIFGDMLWSYAWNIRWCYNGATITSLTKWRTVWTNVGWSFKGDIAENQSGGVGRSSYWHYAQGDFCLLQTWTCVAHSYPWVNQTVYGNGNYSGSGGGS